MQNHYQATIVDKNNQMVVSGVLNFETATRLWQDSVPLFAKYSEIKIDLSEVTSANSAGLALIIEWRKLCRAKKQKIFILNIPEQLQSIAQVAGISLPD